jgi:hypothetical protein
MGNINQLRVQGPTAATAPKPSPVPSPSIAAPPPARGYDKQFEARVGEIVEKEHRVRDLHELSSWRSALDLRLACLAASFCFIMLLIYLML